jgi:hypothetical protein
MGGAEQFLHTADYVEARGILLPAIEYLQRAVDNAHVQGSVTGALLVQAAEAHMSMGNVTASRTNDRYYQQAMIYLREAADMDDYSLPAHLEQCVSSFGTTPGLADTCRYLDENGLLYPAS